MSRFFSDHWRGGLIGAIVLPVAATFLPIWTVWYRGSMCVSRDLEPFWWAVTHFRSWSDAGDFLLDTRNNVVFVGSIWLGAAAGLLVSYGWSLPPEPTRKTDPVHAIFHVILLGVLFIGGCSVLRAEDDFAPEYTKAEGTWVVTGMEMDGEAVPAAGFKDMRIVLKGKIVVAINKKDTIAEGTYAIVCAKGKWVSFDLSMTAGGDKGKSFPAINEWVDENTIRTVLLQPGKPRPTGEAKPQKGDGAAVFVIQRQK